MIKRKNSKSIKWMIPRKVKKMGSYPILPKSDLFTTNSQDLGLGF